MKFPAFIIPFALSVGLAAATPRPNVEHSVQGERHKAKGESNPKAKRPTPNAKIENQTPGTQPPTPDLLAPPEEKPVRGVSYPSISPDGKTLCFTYIGDLWTVSAEGGVATRLTVHESQDALSRWSPDGKWIAFTSLRTGNADVFLVPSQGGEARRVTFHSGNDWICDWSADGTSILFYSVRDAQNFDLYRMNLKTHAVKRVVHDADSLRYGNWSPDGKQLVYTRSG